MKNNKKVCGLLGLATKAGKIVFGSEACKSAIEKKKIKLVIIAEDASENTKSNYKRICEKENVPIYEALTIEEISNAIGKNNKAIIGISDINFSNEISKIINGGEVIG